MPRDSWRRVFGLAAVSSLLLLPTALWTASAALSGPMGVITFWGLLPLALVVIVLVGAWAARTTSRPGLWGKIIVGSCLLQFFASWLAGWIAVWNIRVHVLVVLAVVLLGVILGMMSGILLIAEQRRS